MRRILFTLISMIVFIFSIGAHSQDNFRKHPGFIDLSNIEIPECAENITEVSIGPEIFRMLAGMGDSSQEDIPDKLENLFSIQIKSFDIDSMVSEKMHPVIEKIEKKLKKENWKSIVRVREGKEVTNISLFYDENKKESMGLFIMSYDPGNEAAFVNIVGNVNINDLKKFNVNLSEDALDSLKKTLEK